MIVAAAIKQGGIVYSVPRPGRHHHVIKHMVDCGIEPPIFGEQGFLTEDGTFVDREEARRIAIEAGQVVNPDHPRELFSEDLW